MMNDTGIADQENWPWRAWRAWRAWRKWRRGLFMGRVGFPSCSSWWRAI